MAPGLLLVPNGHDPWAFTIPTTTASGACAILEGRHYPYVQPPPPPPSDTRVADLLATVCVAAVACCAFAAADLLATVCVAAVACCAFAAADLLATVCCAAVICCAFAAALRWPRHRYVVWLALAALTYASDSLGFDGVERMLADITTLVLFLVASTSALSRGVLDAHGRFTADTGVRMPVAWTYAPTIVMLFADALMLVPAMFAIIIFKIQAIPVLYSMMAHDWRDQLVFIGAALASVVVCGPDSPPPTSARAAALYHGVEWLVDCALIGAAGVFALACYMPILLIVGVFVAALL
jgi:hypothetical protein